MAACSAVPFPGRPAVRGPRCPVHGRASPPGGGARTVPAGSGDVRAAGTRDARRTDGAVQVLDGRPAPGRSAGRRRDRGPGAAAAPRGPQRDRGDQSQPDARVDRRRLLSRPSGAARRGGGDGTARGHPVRRPGLVTARCPPASSSSCAPGCPWPCESPVPGSRHGRNGVSRQWCTHSPRSVAGWRRWPSTATTMCGPRRICRTGHCPLRPPGCTGYWGCIPARSSAVRWRRLCWPENKKGTWKKGTRPNPGEAA
jgi:hypothetical protein